MERDEPRVRTFLPEDGPGVVETIRGTYKDLNYVMDFDAFDRDLADIAVTYQDAGGEFWVLETVEGIVGIIGALPEDAETCELKRLYLRRSYRGRGLGGVLLETALSWARERGFRRVVLWSDILLEAARRLYIRHGFTPTGRTRAVDPTNPTSVERYFVKESI